jgi:hypothetical protein
VPRKQGLRLLLLVAVRIMFMLHVVSTYALMNHDKHLPYTCPFPYVKEYNFRIFQKSKAFHMFWNFYHFLDRVDNMEDFEEKKGSNCLQFSCNEA